MINDRTQKVGEINPINVSMGRFYSQQPIGYFQKIQNQVQGKQTFRMKANNNKKKLICACTLWKPWLSKNFEYVYILKNLLSF